MKDESQPANAVSMNAAAHDGLVVKEISRQQTDKKCPNCQTPVELVVERWELKWQEILDGEMVYCPRGCYELVVHDPWEDPRVSNHAYSKKVESLAPWEDPKVDSIVHSWGPYRYRMHGTLDDIPTKGGYEFGEKLERPISDEELKALREHLGKSVEIRRVAHYSDDVDGGDYPGTTTEMLHFTYYRRFDFEKMLGKVILVSVCGYPVAHRHKVAPGAAGVSESIESVEYQGRMLLSFP
ncbi:MAG: hypothetical protein FJY76_00470 [Candidatus Aenigmarchaeota archaeon]|nr:hypothetical protein [Candidatus Aenigmarchaeota archaeon]